MVLHRRRNVHVSCACKGLDRPETLCLCCAGNRYDSSLGLLTKKFVQLVEAAPDGVLDLNKAAESLNVSLTFDADILNIRSPQHASTEAHDPGFPASCIVHHPPEMPHSLRDPEQA